MPAEKLVIPCRRRLLKLPDGTRHSTYDRAWPEAERSLVDERHVTADTGTWRVAPATEYFEKPTFGLQGMPSMLQTLQIGAKHVCQSVGIGPDFFVSQGNL